MPKTLPTLRIALLASLGAFALAACGDSKTDPAKEQEVIAKVVAWMNARVPA